MMYLLLEFDADFVSSFISKIFNESLENTNLSDDLKLADITLVLRKINPDDKASHRPVSISPALS